MRVVFVLLSFFFWAFSVGAVTNSDCDFSSALGSVVRVEVNTENETSHGSGIVVDARDDGSTFVLTAYHVVDSPEGGLWVITADGTALEAWIEDVRPESDLALLGFRNPFAKTPFVPLLEEEPELGAKVVAFGFPLEAVLPQRHEGVLNELWSFEGRRDAITTLNIRSGDSGAGALVCQEGQVAILGVVRGSFGKKMPDGRYRRVPNTGIVSVVENLLVR